MQSNLNETRKINPNKEVKIYPLCEKKEFLEQIITWNLNEWGHCWKSMEEARRVVVEQYDQRMNKQPPLAYVAVIERNGRELMIGTFSLAGDGYHFFSPDPKAEMNHLFLSRLIVDQDFRGQGIGSYLISQAEDLAKDFGYAELNLFMLTEEQKLFNFYKQKEWKETETRSWEGTQITIMHRTLPTPKPSP
jgi:GNAT superfamily N-acetyltransferase